MKYGIRKNTTLFVALKYIFLFFPDSSVALSPWGAEEEGRGYSKERKGHWKVRNQTARIAHKTSDHFFNFHRRRRSNNHRGIRRDRRGRRKADEERGK